MPDDHYVICRNPECGAPCVQPDSATPLWLCTNGCDPFTYMRQDTVEPDMDTPDQDTIPASTTRNQRCREKKMAAGRCIVCGRKPLVTKRLCAKHRQTTLARSNRYRARQKLERLNLLVPSPPVPEHGPSVVRVPAVCWMQNFIDNGVGH